MAEDGNILMVKDLSLMLGVSRFALSGSEVLRGISFSLRKGESLSILGRAASGKSVLLQSLSGWFQGLPVRRKEGEVLFDNLNLLKASSGKLLSIRGRRVAHVLQDAYAMFNDRLTIAQHFRLVLKLKGPEIKDWRAHARKYLYRVGVIEPEMILDRRCFPFELDTMTRQKIMVATSLACEPELLIVDEPTSEFDHASTARLAATFEELKRERGLSIVLATGCVRRAERFGERIAVLEKGELVECDESRRLLEKGQHPATRRFVEGAVQIGMNRERLGR